MATLQPVLLVVAVSLAWTHIAVADPAPPPQSLSRLRGHVVDRANGGPVEGAQVHVTDTVGTERVVVTDRSGRYELDLIPGTYDVAFAYGQTGSVQRVALEPKRTAVLDGKVDSTDGEVIIIRDRRAPKVPPRAINHSPRGNPPYSQEALDKDAWTRAWVVLDVSATGEVTRFKFLKRPGYDLERITAGEVFKLRFDPARDHDGKAVRTWLVWGLEWPSNGWLNARLLPRTMAPPTIGFPPRKMSDRVPCKGSGPMLLHSVYPTYRDCSVPNLARMPHEPWVVKPEAQAAHAAAEAPGTHDEPQVHVPPEAR